MNTDVLLYILNKGNGIISKVLLLQKMEYISNVH